MLNILKDKLILFSLMIFIINFYSCQINTTNPQTSVSIADSKHNGLFIKQYILKNCSDKDIKVEEVWLEKLWFNKIINFNVVKAPDKAYQLCFKLRQTPNMIFRIAKFSDWLIKYEKTEETSKSDKYVGIHTGIYNICFNDIVIPDTVSFDLMIRDKTESKKIGDKVGRLVFKISSNK